MHTTSTCAHATALALLKHTFNGSQKDLFGLKHRVVNVYEAHRKHVCVRHWAGLLEVVLQCLPCGLLGQVVCEYALAAAAATAAAASSAFRPAPLPGVALRCLQVKILPVLPASTQALAAWPALQQPLRVLTSGAKLFPVHAPDDLRSGWHIVGALSSLTQGLMTEPSM